MDKPKFVHLGHLEGFKPQFLVLLLRRAGLKRDGPAASASEGVCRCLVFPVVAGPRVCTY